LKGSGDPALSGRTVVVTRAAHQASALTQRLRLLGARVIEVPTIALAPPADGGRALAAAVKRLAAGGYSWAVFTSANAVDRFFEGAPGPPVFGRAMVAAVGPGTAAALRAHRAVADLVPADSRGEGLAASFPTAPPPPAPRAVLLPQAAGARPELREGLARRGWEVDVVEAYRTIPHMVGPALLAAASQADAVCFASSSAVTSYLDQAGTAPLPPVVACIGPVTAATARARGLVVSAEASEHTLDGLVAALVTNLSGPGRPGGSPG
jgi:uroporphyrinogen-III synthase